MTNSCELLAPAGDMDCLKTAARFGADAVYVGGPFLQLRAQKSAFTRDELCEAAAYLHGLGKRLYVAVNSFTREYELAELADYARFLAEAGANAVIVSDLGAMAVIHKAAPDLPIHVSTQANCCNSAAARVYKDLGAERIVLARELTLTEIAALHAELGDALALEAFVHGAMCMAYSGRCLMSSFLAGRSGNRGECTQPCRWEYQLLEQHRPNEYFTVEGYDKAAAVLSSHDLKTIGFLDKLQEAGVTSFKIEGRMKTEFYVAQVVNAYRHALDGDVPLPVLEHELDAFSHRPYSSGFYFGDEQKEPLNDGLYRWETTFAGRAVKDVSNGVLTLEQRNFFRVGDVLEVITPGKFGQNFTVTELRNEAGERCETACHPKERLTLPCPVDVRRGDLLRARVRKEAAHENA